MPAFSTIFSCQRSILGASLASPAFQRELPRGLADERSSPRPMQDTASFSVFLEAAHASPSKSRSKNRLVVVRNQPHQCAAQSMSSIP
eukprot:scaffold61712_cov69-Phaeocystis_antarctica.AAC.19